MIEIDSTVRHDMPANFGPSVLPNTTRIGSELIAGVRFETDPDALAAILPRHFVPGADPVVDVAARMERDVDWMHGRDYNIVQVTVPVIPAGADEDQAGKLTLVAWENDGSCVFLGREFLGIPKLWAEIPDLRRDGPNWSFECFEYGSRLVHGELTDMEELGPDAVAALNAAGPPAPAYGWKYIAGGQGEVDADYGVRIIPGAATFTAAWRGRGEVTFETPTPSQAPVSSQVVAGLSRLPVVAAREAYAVARVDVTFPRSATARLEPANA